MVSANATDVIVKSSCPNVKRIYIAIEKRGKTIKKELSPRIICALFDLQYMLTDKNWKEFKINKMDVDMSNFFAIIEQVDDVMHDGDPVRKQKTIKAKILWDA